jgi:hypothetical protein
LNIGRWGTGAYITGEALRIELSYLLRERMIKRNGVISGTLSWTNGSKFILPGDLLVSMG